MHLALSALGTECTWHSALALSALCVCQLLRSPGYEFCVEKSRHRPSTNITPTHAPDDEPCSKATEKFKALTLKNTQELVAYGLGGERAPLLKQNTARRNVGPKKHVRLYVAHH